MYTSTQSILPAVQAHRQHRQHSLNRLHTLRQRASQPTEQYFALQYNLNENIRPVHMKILYNSSKVNQKKIKIPAYP